MSLAPDAAPASSTRKPLGGRAQRISLGLHLLGDDEAPRSRDLSVLSASGNTFTSARPRAGASRAFAALQATGSSGEASSRSCRAASRPASVSDRSCHAGFPRPGAACRAALRPAARNSRPRSSAPRASSSSLKHRFGVHQPQRFPRGNFRPLVVAAKNDAGEFARAERNHEAASGLARDDAASRAARR